MSTPATQPVKTKSKAYSSTVAIQGDAAKYRQKYKELKRKTREIEVENDKLHLKTLRIKRNIQRMRLERAILYERLESDTQQAGVEPAIDGRRESYAAEAGAHANRGEYSSYHPGVDRRGSAAHIARTGPIAAPSYDRKERIAYGYERDYPPPPSQPHSAYNPSYEARPLSPQHQQQPLLPPAPTSTGDRAERLRQYTPSVSPEPHPTADSDPNSRSAMKITLRRGV